MMDNVDRDMERAEQQASRQYSDAWVERMETRQRRESAEEERERGSSLNREQTRSSILTSSTDSSSGSSSRERDMGRIATASGAEMARIRTAAQHPIEIYRTQTHALQHNATVGARMKTRMSNLEKDLPNFGGGKPYPPDLPPYEDYVVEFDGPDDPLHPMNWPFKKKFYVGAILSYCCLCSTFTSSLFSASTQKVASVFHVGVTTATLSTSLYVLGYAFGPLIWGPFSELQGRKLPISIALLGFSLFNFACATAFNLQTLLICRFFTGFFGSCPLAVVAACFSDMFDNKQRGAAIVVFSSTVFLGPMLGPFIGGFIETSYLGWRWNLYLPGIMGSFAMIMTLIFVRETYAPVILVEKAAELRRLTLNWGIHAKQEEIEVDLKELMSKNFTRPIRLLVSEPIILAVTIYMSFVYGLIYLFLTAYPLVFQGVHGMKPGVAGLPFFGMMVGIIIISCYIVFIDAPSYNKKLDANDGIPVPEWRLPPVMLGGIMFTIGLFWFGWTGFTPKIHWIVPTLSGLCTGFGLLAIFIQLFNYIIDSYLMFAASAVAANTFLRSFAAAAFPLFARQMFNGMGIQWATTLIGCLSAGLVPIPFIFYFYGKKLRARSKFAPTMQTSPSNDTDSDASTIYPEMEYNFPALAATKSKAYDKSRTTSRTTSRAVSRNVTRVNTRATAARTNTYGNARRQSLQVNSASESTDLGKTINEKDE